MNEVNDISSEIHIKNDLANRFKGVFRLFREEPEDLDSQILIYQRKSESLHSAITIRVTRKQELTSRIKIVYSDYADMDSTIDTISVNEMYSMFSVYPHNRFKGSFNLMAAPEETVILNSIEDATTRNREDLRTINYGDTKSMMIGHSNNEDFYSFLKFEDLNLAIPDLKIIKSAKLRIYYTTFVHGANIQLGQPNTIWREMGVTDANRPRSIEVLKDNGYSINTTERYIEFDFLDVTKRWANNELDNYGVIISTEDDNRYYLMTRESPHPPELIVRYITSKIYSIGRSEPESKIFIYGAGRREMRSKINIHSDIGQTPLYSSVYIHRYEAPMAKDISSQITVSKPDLQSRIFITIGDKRDLNGSFKVIEKGARDNNSCITISRPDLYSRFTIDNNMALKSTITFRQKGWEDNNSLITISRPDLPSQIIISEYRSGRRDLFSTILINKELEAPLVSSITISRPDLQSMIKITAKGQADLKSVIQAREYKTLSSSLTVNRPDLSGFIDVKAKGNADLYSMIQAQEIKALSSSITINRPDLASVLSVMYHEDMPSSLFVRESKFMNSVIDVVHATDMNSQIVINIASDTNSMITINRPDLPSSMKVRVTREKSLESKIRIRQRDAVDLTCVIRIGGSRNRNMIIMF